MTSRSVYSKGIYTEPFVIKLHRVWNNALLTGIYTTDKKNMGDIGIYRECIDACINVYDPERSRLYILLKEVV
ncbi:MAG TPA: hypothetical protein VIN08_14265 [Ohtaekwangia sp.]|uniref:hypothetical protein n=1 Tax=Ohtaekwangia sp. TaxID=2066019 RepID=UPI002F92F248